MIKIYNTLKKKIEEFKPLKEGQVKIYVCGPTVYNYIHIGNARPVIFFDTVRRYLEYRNYKVTYVSNFTDVDDKMIKKANEEGVSVKEIADRYIAGYLEDTKRVNIKEEGMIRPKATEHIKEMIQSIKILEKKGYAYESNGDVYFDVEAYRDEYGILSGQKIEDLKAGARIEVTDLKKSPVDFALWKKAKESELHWDSPWGKGRPGWHIECSAMSKKYLGATFDIHGGGQDLIFPHHENEVAQSRACYGGEFARYWMHNGYINIKGEKMSKSKGNFFLLRDILKDYEGKVVRFFMVSSHYRKPVDFSDQELEMAKSGVARIENSILSVGEKLLEKGVEKKEERTKELSETLEGLKEKFIQGMNEDFNTAIAIGVTFELVKEMNKLVKEELSDGEKDLLKEMMELVKTIMVEVLGIDISIKKVVKDLTKELTPIFEKLELTLPTLGKDTETLIEELLEVRRKAKKEKNYSLSDTIREELEEIGVTLKDGREKTLWMV